MAFRPLLPYSGNDGWLYLKSTLDAQRLAYDAALPTLELIDQTYFRNNVANATSAAKLIDDPGLLNVAMDAFGLSKARPARAFVEAALTTATSDEAAYLAKFKDERWLALAKAFGYGDRAGGRTGDAGFADAVIARRRILGFEQAVGSADPALKRALAFDRAIQGVAAAGYEPAEGWRRALGDEATRRVLKGALGLGSTFDSLSPTAQADAAANAAQRLLGVSAVSAFGSAEARDAVIKRYLDAEKAAALGSTRPTLGGSGMRGWEALESSLDAQQARFDAATQRDPELRYFAKAVAKADSAELLVADERLVATALKAFGLGEQKPTDAFLLRVLGSDTADEKSFARSLADPRWTEFARAFGYGDGRGPQVAEDGFAEDVAARWRLRSFEQAVGRSDDDMRLALVFDRAIQSLAGQGLGREEGWTRALGHSSIGWVLQQALDLPRDFATKPAAEQAALAREAAKTLTGSDRIDAFATERARDALLGRFFAAEAADDRRKPAGLGAPVIPVGGVAGWRFLQRTLATQQARFEGSSEILRETRYFRERIGSVESAEDLVKDRRLLAVALGAFGLEAETDKRFFIRRALEEGSESRTALASRLVDPRYRELAAAFGFGDGRGAQTRVDGFAEAIIARYTVRAFETAVGEQDQALRLALNFERSAQELARQPVSDTTAWMRLLGDVPMRSVVETALGLPREFSQVAIETQVTTVRTRIRSLAGGDTVKGFADPKAREGVIRGFLMRDQIANSAAPSRGAMALQLLQGAGRIGPGLDLRA